MWQDREIDKVTKGLLRQILGVHKKSTVAGLRGETGKYPLNVNIYTKMMKYWTRLLTTDSALLREAHMDCIERFKAGKNSWIRPIVYLLRIQGTEIDIPKICENRNAFARRWENNLKKGYREHWEKENLTNREGKLRFYCELKKNFIFERYLDNIPRDLRKGITKLRIICTWSAN